MKGIFGYDSPLMTALTSVGDCICLSVLWIVFSLPVVTMGASTTALYSAAHHVIRRKEGALWRHFWDAFRENFKRSTLAGLVVLALMALLTVDIFVLRGIKMSGGRFGDLYYVVLVLWCLGLTWAVYTAAYAARFNGSVKDVLKFGAMLMALHPVRMLGVMLPVLGCLAFTLIVPFMALILPGAVFVIIGFTTERVFRMHMSPEDLARDDLAQADPMEDEEDNDDQ